MDLVNSSVLACDVGGSHVTAAIVDVAKLMIAHALSVPLDPAAPAAVILKELEDAGRQAAVESGIEPTRLLGIACAFPAPFDYGAGVSLLKHKYAALYQSDLKMELSRRLGVPPEAVTFMHDAQAFLLGEVCQGTARGAGRAMGVTLGTGIGSAFAVGAKIVEQGPGVPEGGELYHLPWRGATVEDAVSTRRIQRCYKEKTGMTLSVKEIMLRAGTDCFAAETVREFGADLGRILETFAPVFDPDVIVLGGGISRSAPLFLPFAAAELKRCRARIAVSSLLDEAAIVGLAVHWKEATNSRQNPAREIVPTAEGQALSGA
jgi:glucokinase